MLLLLSVLAGCGSCGGEPAVSPTPAAPAAPAPAPNPTTLPAAKPSAEVPNPMKDMPDMGAPPVPLQATLTTVEATDAAGAPALQAKGAGPAITLIAQGAPICDGEGATVSAERKDIQIQVTVTGGTACPAGKTGKVVLQTADQVTNVRGTEVLVTFAGATTVHAGPAPIRR